MKKLTLIPLAALVVITVAAPHVMAEQGEHKKIRHNMMSKMFEKGDANQDGAISKAEFLTSAENMFAEIDQDKNGELTKSEFKEFGKKKREQREKNRASKKSE